MIGYIYSLHDKVETDIFYIGFTTNPKRRLIEHKRKYPFYKYGYDIHLLIIEDVEFSDIKEIMKIESYWIQQFLCWGFDLINTDKGYGFNLKLLQAYAQI